MKIAFVYDRVNKWGGAERVLLALHEIWPEAPLYTSVYNPKTAPWAKDFKVVPSFLQSFPFAKTNHEFYAPLMPMAFESFNFDDYETVISLTSEAAKGIITKPQTLHLCYCLTPTRYLWSGYEEYFDGSVQRLASRKLVNHLRDWDRMAAQRPDKYIAISKTVQERIKKYYGRESEVIYPPIDTGKFQILNSKSQISSKYKIPNTKYFLVVSRLVKYKKVDLAVETFNRLGWPLKIAGVGREYERLQLVAKKNIEFLGQLTEQELLGYYQNCQAVVCPQEEDFGLVPLEAQLLGKPVIAFAKGGATETVLENKTGLFFREQTVESLSKALKKFKAKEFKAEECHSWARNFGQARFKKEFKNKVEEKWQDHLKIICML